MMPRSKDGVPIQARDYNRSDGFSPGQIIVTLVPGSTCVAAARRLLRTSSARSRGVSRSS
jgi:hypothetical protein